MVLSLLLVTCSLCSWTDHPRLSYNLSGLFFFSSAMGNTNNALPTGILGSSQDLPELRASQFYEGAVWSDASVSRWATDEFFPGGLTSDNQFVNSLLSSQGEKPSPAVAGETGSWSAGKWVLIHWATASGSYPKLPAFIRRLQIWRITSNWKLMHIFFLKREALNLKWCGDSALRYLSIHYLLCVP